jgi:hypothetical protein
MSYQPNVQAYVHGMEQHWDTHLYPLFPGHGIQQLIRLAAGIICQTSVTSQTSVASRTGMFTTNFHFVR